MKQYNGEKAIISLTSWKARINTVGLTLFSIMKRCPGFHIVLVLSEEEFPKKEAALPDSVMAFVDQDLIEILWVYKNYKAFKKVLFTMDKYRDTPVISADDDCIYKCNYAEKLYYKWKRHKKCIVCNNVGSNYGFKWGNGPYTLYPPYCFKEKGIKYLTEKVLSTNNDDAYLGYLSTRMHINIIGIHAGWLIEFHDTINGLGEGPRKYNAQKDFKTIGESLDEYNWE